MKPVRTLFAGLLAAAAFAPAASAEEVVLRSGARYEAKTVEILPGATAGEGNVRFSFVMGKGGGTMTVPFDRLEPRNLFGLVLSRTGASDAKGQLALARFALARGLFAEAEDRFRRAATLDATLVPDRDAGLAAIRAARNQQALAAAESDLKRGRSDLALGKAQDVLARSEPGSDVAARAAGIVDLATRVLERDKKRLAEQAAVAAAAAQAAQGAAFDSAIARADAAILAGVKERAKVADPGLSAAGATRALEVAEARIREGRRLLQGAFANAGERLADVEARDKEALELLVATDLDLADLHRQARRFDRARDFLRAAQALEPANPRVREIRDLIEQDLRTPPPYYPDPDEVPSVLYYPSFGTTIPYSYPYGSIRRSGYSSFHGYGRWGDHFRWRLRW
jgi:hypothetical protein